MHELSVTESILEIALRHANQAGASQISDLYLVMGQLSSVVDDSVQFYWDILTQDTIAQGARLHFRRISTELLCLDCNKRFTPGPEELTCPYCAGNHLKVVAGDEFYLEAIDVQS